VGGRLIATIREDDVEEVMGNLVVVALAGVMKELDIPFHVRKVRDRWGDWEIHTEYPDFVEERLKEAKEDVRAALKRRLDIMAVRRIMRMLYATTIEEP
jgi:hypothetical protein